MTLLIPVTAAAVFALLERLTRLRFRPSPLLRRYFGSDVIYLLTGYVAGSSLAILYIVVTSRWIEEALGLPRLAALDVPMWITVPVALVALDLGNYVSHLLLHRVDALWELHKVHHSSRTLDWLATFRSHFFEQTLRRLVAPLVIIAAGFPVDAVIAASGILLVFAMSNHSNLRIDLRWVEPIFVTPRLHRLHHMPATTDRNLGTVFTIWDRLRQSLVVREADALCVFGVPGAVTTYPQGWGRQFIAPLRRVLTYPVTPTSSGSSSAHVVTGAEQVMLRQT